MFILFPGYASLRGFRFSPFPRVSTCSNAVAGTEGVCWPRFDRSKQFYQTAALMLVQSIYNGPFSFTPRLARNNLPVVKEARS